MPILCLLPTAGRPRGLPVLPFEEIGRKIEETLALNGTGILLQGGVHPDLPLSYYEDLLGYIREHYPAIHLHAFSPPEVRFIAKKERMSFFEVIARLKKAGLMSIPGGGAEILSDGDPQGGPRLPEGARRTSGSTSCGRRTPTVCALPRR